MSSFSAQPDEWLDLLDGLRLFVGHDPLMPRGWRSRVDVGPGRRDAVIEVRGGPMPAGWRMEIGSGLLVRDTGSFPRLSTEEFRAQVASDHVRVIRPDQIRRAVDPADPWAGTEEGRQ